MTKDKNEIPEFIRELTDNIFKYNDANEDDSVYAVKVFFKTRTYTWFDGEGVVNEDGLYVVTRSKVIDKTHEEKLLSLIKKAQTPKGNIIIDWLKELREEEG